MLVSEIQAGSAKRKKYTGKWNKRPKYHNIMEGMSANMIKIENLVKRYGNLVALDHLDLEIAKGEIFGLLGPSGCGRTTAIGCILALLRYDKGEITICGEKMTPESYELKRKIGIVPQEVAIFDQLTVQENIDYFCGLYLPDRKKRKEYVEDAITFVGLNDYKKMYPKQLSGGLLRRLNIACGIAHKPEIIFMDEPTVAVDPQSRNHILEGIRKLNQTGATIIYTSHYMEEVEQICTQIAILDHGQCIAKGTKEELKQMIRTGEKITVEEVALSDQQLEHIRQMEQVYAVDYQEQVLLVRFDGTDHNIVKLLQYLQEQTICFGRVYSELPTLNDVFLEITGKNLRD